MISRLTLLSKFSGWLVSQQNAWPCDDRASDGDALLLATGELGRRVVLAGRKPNARKSLRGELTPLRSGGPAIDQGKLDVLRISSPIGALAALRLTSGLGPTRISCDVRFFAVLEA
jgi:hypothetical protein